MEQSNPPGEKKSSYALITGASSGIGREFAVCLAREGYSLILAARRKDRLIQLAAELEQEYDCKCVVQVTDLRNMQECYELFDRIRDYPLEIVINNAGFGDCGYFSEGNIEKEMAMVDVNVKAMHLLMKLALNRFQSQIKQQSPKYHPNRRKADSYRAYILNVASSAGLIPAGPYMAVYYATKSYVTSLTRGVAEELYQTQVPIYVGCLCPGPVDTEFNQAANVQFALPGISPQKCAEYGISRMKRGKVVIVPGILMKAAVVFGRFLPEKYYIKLTARQQKKKFFPGK